MKVLVVCSANSGRVAPFIAEQVQSLETLGLKFDYFLIKQRGIRGYLASRKGFLEKIREFRPDIIHAHYGLSGSLANLQRKIAVVTTYHGSDINDRKAFLFSKLSIALSAYNIFVSEKSMQKARVKKNFSVIPCGVDTRRFYPQDKARCRELLALQPKKKYVLFASAFDNKVKNASLAQASVKRLKDVELLELKGYDRKEVASLMSAVDCCLMTSHTEGSPQFIKEAMACNCPVVATDVGDVKSVLGQTEGCFLTDFSVSCCVRQLEKALDFADKKGKTNGREQIVNLGLDEVLVAQRLIEVYKSIQRC